MVFPQSSLVLQFCMQSREKEMQILLYLLPICEHSLMLILMFNLECFTDRKQPSLTNQHQTCSYPVIFELEFPTVYLPPKSKHYKYTECGMIKEKKPLHKILKTHSLCPSTFTVLKYSVLQYVSSHDFLRFQQHFNGILM